MKDLKPQRWTLKLIEHIKVMVQVRNLDRAGLTDLYAEMIERVRVWKARMNDARNMSSSMRAAMNHVYVDKASQADMEKHKISCREGCSACCYQQVEVTSDEADLILEYVQGMRHFRLDWDAVEAHANLPVNQDQFLKEPVEKRPCVFLDGHRCAIYPVRPMTCRTHFAVSDPKECDTSVSIEKRRCDLVVTEETEIIMSAAFQVNRRGPLARMLMQKVNNRYG